MKRALAGLIVAVAVACAAVAGPLEDGNAVVAALKLIRPLAERGNAVAEYILGAMYLYGQGVPQDFEQAAEWHRKAADQGIAAAQYNLGLMNFKGQGVRQDFAEAMKRYRQAADQGLGKAQAAVGMMYESGHVPQDYVLAYMWLDLAAAQGVQIALKFRDDLATKMTPDQIAEARRMARDWKPMTKP